MIRTWEVNYGQEQYRSRCESKVHRAGKDAGQLAEEIDTTKAYVNRVIKKNDSVVNNTFVKMMEALGYDIELHYVKRDE